MGSCSYASALALSMRNHAIGMSLYLAVLRMGYPHRWWLDNLDHPLVAAYGPHLGSCPIALVTAVVARARLADGAGVSVGAVIAMFKAAGSAWQLEDVGHTRIGGGLITLIPAAVACLIMSLVPRPQKPSLRGYASTRSIL